MQESKCGTISEWLPDLQLSKFSLIITNDCNELALNITARFAHDFHLTAMLISAKTDWYDSVG